MEAFVKKLHLAGTVTNAFVLLGKIFLSFFFELNCLFYCLGLLDTIVKRREMLVIKVFVEKDDVASPPKAPWFVIVLLGKMDFVVKES